MEAGTLEDLRTVSVLHGFGTKAWNREHSKKWSKQLQLVHVYFADILPPLSAPAKLLGRVFKLVIKSILTSGSEGPHSLPWGSVYMPAYSMIIQKGVSIYKHFR